MMCSSTLRRLTVARNSAPAITVGILVADIADYAFAASGNWRWMLGLAVAPSAVFGAGDAVSALSKMGQLVAPVGAMLRSG
jgi:hypothetical protein